MINRTIVSYTILNYFEEKGLNQLDLYIPFACKSINKHTVQMNMAYLKYIKGYSLVY